MYTRKKNTNQKKLTSKGWSKKAPKNKSDRITMKNKCGNKCFLSKTTLGFPICPKGTCKQDTKGIYAAYVRARQYTNKHKKYKLIASRAKKMLKKRGFSKNLK